MQMTERSSLTLPVDCRIGASRAQYSALRDAFSASDQIELDAGQVQQADITCLQLLVSAAKTAQAGRKHLRITALSEPLRAAFARAGLPLPPIHS